LIPLAWKYPARESGKCANRGLLHEELGVGIDVPPQEIVSVALTSNGEDEAAVASQMLQGKTAKLESFRGDGAYDDFKLRAILSSGVKQIIPPPQAAVVHTGTKQKPIKAYGHQRNEAVEYIQSHDWKAWKIKEGYHRRSLNEVTMLRYQTAVTAQRSARKMENQKTEVVLKWKILNLIKIENLKLILAPGNAAGLQSSLNTTCLSQNRQYFTVATKSFGFKNLPSFCLLIYE
jgi:hypothetical protein